MGFAPGSTTGSNGQPTIIFSPSNQPPFPTQAKIDETITAKSAGASREIISSTVSAQTFGGPPRGITSLAESESFAKQSENGGPTSTSIVVGNLPTSSSHLGATAIPSGFLGTSTSNTVLSSNLPLSSGALIRTASSSGLLSHDKTFALPIQQTQSQRRATAPTTSISSLKLTTLSDSSTTAIYMYTRLQEFSAITSPTTEAVSYVTTASNGLTTTTFGPVFIGGGGLVLLPSPKPGPPPPGGGSKGSLVSLSDPIRPGPPGAKCPKLLAFLCGSSHTSGSDSGPDIDPNDEHPQKDNNNSNNNNKNHDQNDHNNDHSSNENDNNNDPQNTQVEPSHNDQPTQTTSDVQTTNSRTTETCTTCSSTSETSSMTSSSSTGTATQYIIYPSDSHNTAVFQSKLYNAVSSASVTVSQDNRVGLLWWWTRLTTAQVNSLKDSSVRHTGSFD